MTNKEVATHLSELLELQDLTPEQTMALNIAQMQFDPCCKNCRYHIYIKTLKGKYSIMELKRCSNMESIYRKSYTKDFITCPEWERLLFQNEEETKESESKRLTLKR